MGVEFAGISQRELKLLSMDSFPLLLIFGISQRELKFASGYPIWAAFAATKKESHKEN